MIASTHVEKSAGAAGSSFLPCPPGTPPARRLKINARNSGVKLLQVDGSEIPINPTWY